MTAVVDDAPTTIASAAVGEGARWRTRAGAWALDVLPGTAVLVAAALVALTVPQFGVWWWVAVSAFGLTMLVTAGNRLILPAATGFSLGRAVFGVAVLRHDGTPVGPGRLLLREAAHLLDTAALLVGWFWPLWDARRRTFADMLVGTESRCARAGSPVHSLRHRTAVLVTIAALLCLDAGAMSYFVVYQPDRATDAARTQLAEQGPKIVAELLTYDPKTLDDDFARAQTLTTDNYRGQLTEVQQAVRKGPTPHAYWVPNSAVLSATPDRGTMLMFLQGQAGNPPDIRPVTATVRVRFLQRADRWLVDDLTFVPPPQQPKAGP